MLVTCSTGRCGHGVNITAVDPCIYCTVYFHSMQFVTDIMVPFLAFRRGKKERKARRRKILPQIGIRTLCITLCAIFHVFDAVLRTMESLYEELAREGIIVKCPKTRLSDFVGEYRYVRMDIHEQTLYALHTQFVHVNLCTVEPSPKTSEVSLEA